MGVYSARKPIMRTFNIGCGQDRSREHDMYPNGTTNRSTVSATLVLKLRSNCSASFFF
ncbi:hypothetical protein CLV88_105118 [Shimia abyssi]|uniref:Uncharacterized protein n=1 Tax=Shimia abyssi TaxID=1662395 RepID=A0A2P8FD95_9RHOB|nr:hypothetical protein CLV88_105118 [Shimia abyssi]